MDKVQKLSSNQKSEDPEETCGYMSQWYSTLSPRLSILSFEYVFCFAEEVVNEDAITQFFFGARVSIVSQALRYKPEGREYVTPWDNWTPSMYPIFGPN
jgi:hypothetical protein